tara:strand:- start:190 stop:1026 length:837 start_codon:yes stop_codon:yes gene_type:complete
VLKRAAVKVNLDEPRKKFMEMIAFLENYGTTEIHLIHVRTDTSYRGKEGAESRLGKLRDAAEALGYSVKIHIRTGSPALTIMEVAHSVEADFVAICWSAKALLRQALLGSDDSDLIRMSNLPTFIYNPGLFKFSKDLGSVLYATDFKFTDAAVMPYLINSRFSAHTLYLLHVGERAPDPVTEEKRKERIVDNLERLATECSHAYDNVETIETIGMIRRRIVQIAKNKKVDIVVVGKSEKPGTMSRMLGSTAEVLPHKAPCSVFIIPGYCSLAADGEEA